MIQLNLIIITIKLKKEYSMKALFIIDNKYNKEYIKEYPNKNE